MLSRASLKMTSIHSHGLNLDFLDVLQIRYHLWPHRDLLNARRRQEKAIFSDPLNLLQSSIRICSDMQSSQPHWLLVSQKLQHIIVHSLGTVLAIHEAHLIVIPILLRVDSTAM